MVLSYSNPKLRAVYYRSPTVVKEAMAAAYSFRQRRAHFGGAFAGYLAELQHNRGMSADERATDQLRRLRRVLVHAQSHVPYYQRLFQSVGFGAASLRGLSDLAPVPLLDKEVVREQRDQLLARPPVVPVVHTNTSGSVAKWTANMVDWSDCLVRR